MQRDLLTFLFTAFNLLRLMSYAPQILSIARDENGATAISFSCWMIWIGANATTALYAWEALADERLALINAFNTVCCVVVVLLTAYKRVRAASRATAIERTTPAGSVES